MNYRLRIIGHFDCGTTLKNAKASSHMFSVLLFQHFQDLGVVTKISNVRTFSHQELMEDPTDVILVHTYRNSFAEFVAPALEKARDRYKFSASFQSIHFRTDLNFLFLPSTKNLPGTFVIPAPCSLADLPLEEKESNTVLIDHAWPDIKVPDKTKEIVSVAETMKDTHRFFKVADLEKICEWPSFIQQLPLFTFPEYVKATARFETFIVTHRESYGASVIDMAARGIRILAPVGFLPKANVERFQIQEFKSEDELKDLLRRPWANAADKNRKLCTDMPEVAKIMDREFRNKLGTFSEGALQ